MMDISLKSSLMVSSQPHHHQTTTSLGVGLKDVCGGTISCTKLFFSNEALSKFRSGEADGSLCPTCCILLRAPTITLLRNELRYT